MGENEHLEETCGSEALQETFEWFLRLGMRCSLKQAQSRPGMQQVLKELEGIRRMLNCVSGSYRGSGAAAGAGSGAGAGDGAGGDGSRRRDYSEQSNGERGGSIGAVNSQAGRSFWAEIVASASKGPSRFKEEIAEEIDEDEEESWFAERMRRGVKGDVGKGETSSSEADGLLNHTLTFTGKEGWTDVKPQVCFESTQNTPGDVVAVPRSGFHRAGVSRRSTWFLDEQGKGGQDGGNASRIGDGLLSHAVAFTGNALHIEVILIN
ncbi:unnamed protein product [Closterium sp. NIES-65]|nr:unnamed protein product [Closterium sp. NIES-65]